MSGWIARRWANTARPVIVKLDKPKGFRFNRPTPKPGEVVRDAKWDRAKHYVAYGYGPFVLFCFYHWYSPCYSLKHWARHQAYLEILKEDEEWSEIRKEYGLDRFPRHVWHDRYQKHGVEFPLVTYDPPWPGTTPGGVNKDEPKRTSVGLAYKMFHLKQLVREYWEWLFKE